MSKPASHPPAVARPRGRPPKPGGPKSPAEVQRAYRARLAAAGKVVRIVDAAPASPIPAAFPEFDPERDGIYERAWVQSLVRKLEDAEIRLQLKEKDRARWQKDCALAEAALKQEERRNTNTLKDKIVLQNEVAALKQQLASLSKRRAP